MGAGGKDGSDPVKDLVDGYKKKAKKVCCCGFWWTFIGIILLVSGLALLILYAKFWGEEDKKTEENLAYSGLAFLLISIAMIALGVVFCIALYTMYRRLDKQDFAKSQFRPPKYGPGDAPYPQQPNSAPCFAEYSPLNKGAAAQPPEDPSAPPPPVGFKDVNEGDVHVEVGEHTRF